MEKRLDVIKFDFTDGKEYTFNFGIDEVQQLAKVSLARQGKISDVEFFKIALSKDSNAGYISDKKAEEIREAFLGGVELNDDFLSYEELVAYLINLSIQAIDDAAKEVGASSVKINEDNSVNLTTPNGENFKLTFTREKVVEALENDVLQFNGLLDLYATGSTLVKLSLEHYNKRFSVKKHEEIFLSLWATKFDPKTEDTLIEVIDALFYHMKEVVSSGSKKSKAAFKVKTK